MGGQRTVGCIVHGLVCGILHFYMDRPLSLLPMTGMMLTTVSMWLKDPKWVRRISLPASPLWITYNALTKSYAGVCTELFVITSIIVGMLRHDRKRGKKEKAIEC